MVEFRRKAFHLSFGFFSIALAYYDRELAIAFLFVSLLAGLLLLSRKLAGAKIPIADELLQVFGRPGELPGYGAFWFIFGLLLCSTFISAKGEALSAILMLGIADGVSTLAGIKGRHKLPYNKNKTLEGSLAFAIISVFSVMWIGLIAIPYAILGAIIEGADTRVDDNLLLALYSAAFFLLR
jgi:dolichol kinase